MLGWDFEIFWRIGQAVLSGVDPYSMPYPRYPPIAMISFAVFGWLPYLPAFALWTSANILMYRDSLHRLKLTGRRMLPWYLFTPFIFVLETGQLDIFFFWIGMFLRHENWKAVAAAVIITFKPQVALILLPWFLLRWLLHDRRKLFAWLGASLFLHLIPLAFDPTIFTRWQGALVGEPDWRLLVSPGIFTLTNFNVPLVIPVVLGVGIAVWGLFKDYSFSWITQTIALPAGQWYDGVVLAGIAPWKLIVPVSWVAFILAYLVKNSVPLVAIPLTILAWRLTRPKVQVEAPSSSA